MKKPGEPEPIGDVVRRLMHGRLSRRRKRESEILEVWAKVVGEERTERLVPIRLRGGVLWVGVESPALLYEVAQFERESMITRLAELLPGLGIEDVRFRLA
ncbi:MAG: DciA family protein [Planctomycetota bacterium]